jgi:hypothetical protein
MNDLAGRRVVNTLLDCEGKKLQNSKLSVEGR